MSVKSFLDFEGSLYAISTMPGIGAKEIGTLGDQLINASNASGMAAKGLSEAAYQAISSGVAVDKAAKFAENAAKAAKAGMSDVSTAVDGATSAMNAWNIETDKNASVFGKFLIAQNEGKTTLGELSGSIGQVTGVAPQLGVSLDEVLAAVAALTKNGVQTTSAMTGLKAVMSNVLKPTTEAAKEAKRLGLEFDAAALKSKGLTGFMSDIMDKTQGDSESLAKLFGSVEGLSQIMLLGGSAAKDYSNALAQMSGSANVLEESFGARTASKAERLNMALNRIKNSGIEFGDAFSPVIDKVSGALDGLTEWISDMDEGTVTTVAGMVGVAAAAAPVAKGISTIATASKAAMGFLSGPAGWITLGVVGLSALVIGLTRAADSTGRLNDKLRGMELKVPKSSVDAVTNGINEGIAAADKTHAIKVTVDADTEELQEQLDGFMDDGKLTRKEWKAASKFINEVVQPDIDAAKNTIKTQKEDFKASLLSIVDDEGNQVYTPEAAENLASTLTGKTEKLVSDLTAYKDEYTTVLKAIYRAGRSPTEDEIAYLNDLLAKIGEVRVALAGATDNAQQVQMAKYDRVKQGKGTETEFGEAVGYVDESYDRQLAAQKASCESRVAELRTLSEQLKEARDSGTLAGEDYGKTCAAIAKADAEINKLLDNADADDAALLAEKQTQLQELFDGYAKSNPNAAAALKNVGDMYDVYTTMMRAIRESEDGGMLSDDTINKIITPEMIEKLTGVAPDVAQLAQMKEHAAGTIAMMMAAVQQQLTETVDNMDANGLTDNPMLGWVQAMLDGGALDTLDVTKLEGGLADALALIDLKTRGTEIGEPIVGGVEAGLGTAAAGITATDKDMIALRDAFLAAMKGAFEIHSPAKTAYPVGEEIAAGVGGGLTDETAKTGLKTDTDALKRVLEGYFKAWAGTIGTTAGGQISKGVASGITAEMQTAINAALLLRRKLSDTLTAPIIVTPKLGLTVTPTTPTATDEDNKETSKPKASTVSVKPATYNPTGMAGVVIDMPNVGRDSSPASTYNTTTANETHNQFETNVTIQHADLKSEQSVKQLAKEISALQLRALAGVGRTKSKM